MPDPGMESYIQTGHTIRVFPLEGSYFLCVQGGKERSRIVRGAVSLAGAGHLRYTPVQHTMTWPGKQKHTKEESSPG